MLFSKVMMRRLPLKKRLFFTFIELWLRSLRINWGNSVDMSNPGILALWHQDLFAATAAFRKSGLVAFISPSSDGEILSKIAFDLGYKVVRGSSSEKTLEIREVLRQLKEGNSCAMALDGPKGPALKEKPGTRWLAGRANAPVYKLEVRYGAHFSLRSWDKAKIPLPLSKLTISLSYL